MTIGRIDSVDPIQNKSLSKVNSSAKAVPGDSVHISSEAKEKADILAVSEIVASTEDVRAQRVAELKAKINDPAYLSEAVIANTADKIIDLLFPPSHPD